MQVRGEVVIAGCFEGATLFHYTFSEVLFVTRQAMEKFQKSAVEADPSNNR